ncbi:long-chain-acyl-CoA synthetase [Atopomonas hussainii]|uniref:long-chain-acyl-CoA synthetase n=1 Tax=Atopomonas hussainii TaxID=1429083 RepID=UPI0009002217|nr:long-chain-acyl-CoA synthetase [Atopomonas hussainii]
MSQADLITPSRFIRQLPSQLPRLPRLLKGLYYAGIRNRDKPLSLAWALQKATERNPDGLAVLDEQRRLTYRQFNAWANRLAHVFKADGVKHGDVVAIMLENRLELLATLAALTKLGAIGALINTTQRGKVLIHSLNLVSPKRFVVGEEMQEAFAEVHDEIAGAAAQGVRYFVADADTLTSNGQAPQGWQNLGERALSAADSNLPETAQVRLKDACFYIYTSGTTGLPKASIMSHGKWIKCYGGFGHSGLALNKDDVLYVTLPCYHNNAVTVCWSSALAGGAAIALRRKFSASNFWKDVAFYQATSFGYIGELCRYLLNQPECPEEKNNTLRSMIGNGLRPSIWQEFKTRFGIERVTEFYAASEGNIGFTNVFNFDNTVGYSPATFAIVRYDMDNNRPVRCAKGRLEQVTDGEPGLLISEISKKWPFDGYTDPAKSEAVILRDVFKQGDAWFNTGDMMRAIGCKHAQFVDRLGDTFRWKGENVSTTEVESALMAFPGVEHAIVYGVEIPNTNGRCGMAAIGLAAGKQADAAFCQALLAHLQNELPVYAIPLFLRIQTQLQTTGTFKYQKTDLKRAGFNPAECAGEPLWAWLPGEAGYQALNDSLYQHIQQADLRW